MFEKSIQITRVEKLVREEEEKLKPHHHHNSSRNKRSLMDGTIYMCESSYIVYILYLLLCGIRQKRKMTVHAKPERRRNHHHHHHGSATTTVKGSLIFFFFFSES